MTRYSEADLADGWEFKILTSATGAFRKPDMLRQALEEEGRAGWVLVEKFDTQRIRLKRPAAARSGDSALGFDPYRTTFGTSDTKLAFIIMGCVLGIVAVTLGIIMLTAQR